ENGTIKHITSNNKGKRSRQHADRSENNNLPSIDSVLLKRQRNTDAARRSRLRKLVKMETLEKRVEVLRANNEQLKVKLAVLESEVIHTAEKEERNRQRIQDLEAQLTVAHKQLVNEYQPKESKLEEVTTIEDTRKN
ncbi:hypothetical protein BDF20DRAFT_826335, partial [Mycotypha africana]|uniref:uncharacterized protein n=1 Tax=Mycotypha africana TaxID=64632 RepID=UPI0023007A98